jgi:hypothetical protein
MEADPYRWLDPGPLAGTGLGTGPASGGGVPPSPTYIFFSSATSAVSTFFASPNSIRLLSL